jgi:D-sedoheptulose 7-phosphate isomerase
MPPHAGWSWVYFPFCGSLGEPADRLGFENHAGPPWKAEFLATGAGRELNLTMLNNWMRNYLDSQKAALDSIEIEAVAEVIAKLRSRLHEGRTIFVLGNGGSAANASHFATDLGKGSSDKIGRRFCVLSLNDNVSWLTALGNDFSYEDVYVRQLMNYGKPGDLVLALSVSGGSPNVVKAVEWAKENQLHTVALVGAKRGRLGEIADQTIMIDSTHYGRVEDAQMGICHMLCYSFMENPRIAE